MTRRADAIGVPQPIVALPEAGVIAWWATLLAAVVLIILPLFVVDMPPLEDYPSHLAKMYVHAFGSSDPFLSRMYSPWWHVVPNLASELILPPLLHVLPLHVAGRTVLGLMLLLPFAGIIALHRAIHHRRSWWPLASALIACNGIFLLGFMNFILGVGIALLVAALWTALHERRPVIATVVLALGAVACFFSHILAPAFLGLIVACTMAENLLDRLRRGQDLFRPILRDALVIGIAFAVPAKLYFMSGLSADSIGPTQYGSLAGKVARLFDAVLNYSPFLDVTTAAAILSVPALCLAFRRRGAGRQTSLEAMLPPRIVLAVALLLLIYAAAPWMLNGTGALDLRFPLLASVLLFAGFDPRSLPRPVAVAAAAVLASLFVVRTALVAGVWYGHNTDIADMRKAIAPVQPGSRVLVVRVDPRSNPGWWQGLPRSHRVVALGAADDSVSALLVFEHQAFWPYVLTASPRSQESLKVLPPYRDLESPVDPPDYRLLAHVDPDRPEFPFLRDWQNRWDYVLLVNPSGATEVSHFLTDRLELVTRTDAALLWRVRRPN